MTDDIIAARAAIEKHYARYERERHAAECRYVASLPGYGAMLEYFAAVEEKRGPECATRLREDVRSALRQPKRAA